VLPQEKLYEIGASLKHTQQKSLRHFAQDTSVSKAAVAEVM
jgi:hypothetical protein